MEFGGPVLVSEVGMDRTITPTAVFARMMVLRYRVIAHVKVLSVRLMAKAQHFVWSSTTPTLDTHLSITVSVGRLGNTSFELVYTMVSGSKQIGHGIVVMVTVDSVTPIAVAIPDPMRESLQQFLRPRPAPLGFVIGPLPSSSLDTTHIPLHSRLCEHDWNGHVNNTYYASYFEEARLRIASPSHSTPQDSPSPTRLRQVARQGVGAMAIEYVREVRGSHALEVTVASREHAGENCLYMWLTMCNEVVSKCVIKPQPPATSRL